MYNLKEKFSLQSIRNKIIITFLFGCIVVFFSWIIARLVFRETFSTIDNISKPNPKLVLVNELFQKIHRLDQSQKLQVLKFPNTPYSDFEKDSKHIIDLLDSLKLRCNGDTFQISRIERMQRLVFQRDDLFRNYLNFRNSISFAKDMRSLSEYISQNIKKARPDSNYVRTTKKNTTTTTLAVGEEQKKAEKKESFLKRLFGRKKNRDETGKPSQKLVTEDVQLTVDTFAVTQRDSFMKDMKQVMSAIEKDQSKRGSRLINHELKLTAASNIFIDELQQLLRQVQQEELRDLQSSTESLSSVFNEAFSRVGIILIVFLALTLVLIFLMFSDISQSNKAQLQLIEAKEKAEHLEQIKHRFMANMSHEIRTPLQAIIGYAEQIKDEPKPARHAVEAIYRSSEHLLQIVNEVLDYSRIISGKFTFEKQDFDMTEVLAEVSDTMEGQAEKKDVRFKFKSDIAGNTLYSGDAFRLKQILYNLLGNAIKFTNHGQVAFTVTAKDNGRKTQFIFEVKDTGIGMSAQELGHIFNSFEQAGESIQRKYGGTGLGLSIVKTLTEMQGGSINVSSEKGTGSVFTVKLAYLRSRVRQTQELPIIPMAGATVFAGKVVVVDDDAFILQLCSSILQKHNIRHVCYDSPARLLQDEWDDAVTLVLMDMRMPGMSGVELHRHLKPKVSPHVKFVALTAQALPDEKAAILREGFNRVLLKPFRESDLLQLFNDSSLNGEDEEMGFVDHFDLSSIEAMCVNDKELLQKTLDLFIQQSALDLSQLRAAIANNDRKTISGSCHRLAAKMGQAGLHALAHELRSIERSEMQLHDFVIDKEKLGSLASRIEGAIEQVSAHLLA